MPCAQHGKVDKGCVACFAADLLTFTLGSDIAKMADKDLEPELRRLVKRHGELGRALLADDEDYCNTLIFSLNAKLAARKHALFGAQLAVFIDPATIQEAHRQLYRARLRAMGTWIGFTELATLAEMYGVRFWLAIPSGARWRRWEVGDPRDTLIANPALLWTGNHYEVGTLTQYQGGPEYTATHVIATNPRGDCALESFLIMLYIRGGVFQTAGRDPYRAQRVRTMFATAYTAPRPPSGLLDTTLAAYHDALTELRALLAAELTTTQIDHAIIAEGELPGSVKVEDASQEISASASDLLPSGKLSAWTEYRKRFEQNFALALTVVRASAGKTTCVANIGAAADWLAVVQNVERYDGWPAMKKDGLRSYVGQVGGSLTHTGLMIAQVTTADDAVIFACAAANYHQSLRKAKSPWIYTGVKQSLGEGRDMHTERFALVQLDTWIADQKLVPVGTIQIMWFIEKPMCPDECVPVLKLFTDAWTARGVKVDSDPRSTNLHVDSYFNKNLRTALKRFPAL